MLYCFFFFFQAEDGIRDLVRSRGLGDVYKRQVYSGHVDWYVDYSHGIRLINNQILLDGKRVLLTDILLDPVLYRIFSNEDMPMLSLIHI